MSTSSRSSSPEEDQEDIPCRKRPSAVSRECEHEQFENGSKRINLASGDSENGEVADIVECDSLTPIFVDQYHVVKHIFEYLRLADVLQAATVCRQWAEIGRIVRKQRKNLAYTILYHPYIPHDKLAFEYFNGFEVSDAAKQLVQSGNSGFHPFKAHLSTLHRHRFPALISQVKSVVKKSILDAYDEPQLLIAFGTSSFDKHIVDTFGNSDTNHRKKLRERMKIISSGVSNSIPCLTSFSCGVVATSSSICQTLEMEKSLFPCLAYLAVPKVAGLQAKLFTVTKEQNRALKNKMSVEQCKFLLGIDPENERNLKGIALLHKVTHRTSPFVDAIFQYLKENPKVALGGGVHESVLVSGEPDETITAAGILIYGDEQVSVASIGLQESRISANNLEKIEKLKACLLPNGHSFALMFACNGRGRHMHGRPHVESELFNAHFPSTPVVGAFTLGEFCHEVTPACDDVPATPPKRIDFAYTTVFLLVSYKHLSDNQDSC